MELCAIHAAVMAVATLVLVNSAYFAQGPYQMRVGYLREHMDAFALGLANAVSDVTGPP
ncbi:hypothetical protein ACFCXK_00390 [Streptomyces sp. NPDC056269]|uniref:hypothetical protein n=1 Tax=Streptomyces sp. NPDC056269 TaxID=3345768 RepID=UPI0035DFDEE0